MADELIDVEELMSDYSPAYVEAYMMERVSGQSIEGEWQKKKKKFLAHRFVSPQRMDRDRRPV